MNIKPTPAKIIVRRFFFQNRIQKNFHLLVHIPSLADFFYFLKNPQNLIPSVSNHSTINSDTASYEICVHEH